MRTSDPNLSLERNFRNLFTNAIASDSFPDILLSLTAQGMVQNVNQACRRVLGYSPAEMIGEGFYTFVSEEDQGKVKDFIGSLPAKGSAANFVHQSLKKNSSVCFISWSAYWAEKEQVILAIGREVTGLIAAQQKQLEKEQLFQALIENSFDLLALTDERGNYLYVSDTLNQLFEYNPGELTGTNCFDYMHPDDLPWLREVFTNLLEQGKKIQVPPYRFKKASGDWLWMEAIVTNQLHHPDIRGVVVSVRDITHQIATENKLKEMQQVTALMEGEEKERSRIARDLHDGISGMLAAAKMHFTALSATAAPVSGLKEYIQGMDLLDLAALQVRRTSHNLMPEIVLENGLAEALHRYCSNVNNGRLKFEFVSVGEVDRYSTNFELALYRIAQELISNILRHSKATEALVQLSYQANLLSLTIEDNGVGFCNSEHTEGTGLRSVKKRVEAMNGSIEVHSGIESGTQIYMEFAI